MLNLTSENYNIFIGKNLQNIRKKRGFTQAQLAAKIGVTRETITAYEAGRSHLLDTTLINLSKILKVSTDEILGLKKQKDDLPEVSLRLIKRLAIIDTLPEAIKKHIIKNIDDSIKANQK